jgi:hypothetical protein
MKKINNKVYFRFGTGLFYLIPVWLIIISILILTILAGSFIGFCIVFFLLFFGSTFHMRWVIYFSETHFCTFFFLEGIRKISYERLERVSYKSKFAGGGPNAISVYIKNNEKIKFAKFEVGTFKYIPIVLNFLKEKVNEGVIEEKGFFECGIKKFNEKYIK